MTQEEHELDRVWQVVKRDQRDGEARLACTSRAARAVHEELAARREVVVEDVIQERNVDTARRHISCDKDGGLAFPEVGDLLSSRVLVHGAVDNGHRESKLVEQLAKEFDMVPSCNKHDGPLPVLVQPTEHGDSCSELLVLPDVQVPQVQRIAERGLNIQADEDRVLDARACEGHKLSWQRRRKEQHLPRYGRRVQDLLQLFRKAQLKEPVCFVTDEHLHAGEGDLSFKNMMHQPSRGRNDDIRVVGQMFKLCLHCLTAN
mmetsp:Transcript_51775/g.133511  ORF Transcript_51775/g.133511 Transcript_51775/m.133511 type:complete len:260 (-) Transcript_51775:393-1172(-)